MSDLFQGRPPTPQRTRSTRLVGPPSVSSIHPTQYPLAPSTSARNGSGSSWTVGSDPYHQTAEGRGMAAYEPPKFRTFQERKREKEKLLAVAAGKEWPEPEHQAQATHSSDHPVPQQDISRAPYLGPDGLPQARLLPRFSSSDLAIRQPSMVLPGPGVPLDPANIMPSGTNGQSGRRPLPSPAVQPHRAHMGSFDNSTAYKAGNNYRSPASSSSAPSTTRRLPKPLPLRSNTVQPTSEPTPGTSNPVQGVTDTSRPNTCPPAGHTDYGPRWDRDLHSVKSLDRYGASFSGARPLPAPPVGVGPSKSLDRGPSGNSFITPDLSARSSRTPLGRVPEDLSRRMSEISVSSSRNDQLSRGSSVVEQPQVDNPPASVPILILPDDPSDEEPHRDTPGIPPRVSSPSRMYAFSSIPKISVESHIEEEDTALPVINLPTFSFPDAEGDEDIAEAPTATRAPVLSTVPNQPKRLIGQSGPGIFCARCDGVIIGRIVTAMERRWHPECFQCSICHTLLEHVSSYEHEGQAYCHMDYHDQFAPKCHYCETAIVDSRFITIDDPALGHRYYHELHFFCGECGDPFLDPSKSSAAGTEFASPTDGANDPDDQTKEFIIHGKYAFCVECNVKLHKPKCAGCRKPIRDTALGALGAKWHSECFRCAGCDETFPTASFFPIDNEPFCQDCYTDTLKSTS